MFRPKRRKVQNMSTQLENTPLSDVSILDANPIRNAAAPSSDATTISCHPSPNNISRVCDANNNDVTMNARKRDRNARIPFADITNGQFHLVEPFFIYSLCVMDIVSQLLTTCGFINFDYSHTIFK